MAFQAPMELDLYSDSFGRALRQRSIDRRQHLHSSTVRLMYDEAMERVATSCSQRSQLHQHG